MKSGGDGLKLEEKEMLKPISLGVVFGSAPRFYFVRWFHLFSFLSHRIKKLHINYPPLSQQRDYKSVQGKG